MRGRCLILVVLAAAALGAGCDNSSQTQAQPQQKGAADNLPTVTVSLPLRREIVEWDEYTGRFDSIETVEIRARVSGYLNEVHFKDGQTVKQGDLLVTIDPDPYRAEVDRLALDDVVVLARLAKVDRQRDDLRGVLVLDPLEHDARVQAAGVEQ